MVAWPFDVWGSKPFHLFIADDVRDAPQDRWFHSLNAALRAFERLAPELKSSAWVIEHGDDDGVTVGGISLVRNVVHVQQGERVTPDEQVDQPDRPSTPWWKRLG